MFDLSGQKALITGASGNIGSAISKALHKQGAEIIISGTNSNKLKNLALELGSKCHILTCNLKNRIEIKNLIKETKKILGELNILINNAGITHDTLLVLMKDEEWDKVLEINLRTIFLLTRAFIKPMIHHRSGRIINISSVVSTIGNSGQTNYCASKAGIIGMSKALAQEVATRGITVNCIAPGFILSKMTNKLNKDKQEDILKKIPMKMFGSPEDIAYACVYLSSKESKYMTGQTLHINGGMIMI